MTLLERLRKLNKELDNKSPRPSVETVTQVIEILKELEKDETEVTKEMVEIFDTPSKRKVLVSSFMVLLSEGIEANFT